MSGSTSASDNVDPGLPLSEAPSIGENLAAGRKTFSLACTSIV